MKKLFIILTSLLIAYNTINLRAEDLGSDWKTGISYSHDIDPDKYGRDRTYIVSLDGGYRYNLNRLFYADASVSLYYQKFCNVENAIAGLPTKKLDSWGIGLSPKTMIGGKFFGAVEISTGPSIQYLFAFHKDNWEDAKRFSAFWNFRLGCTIANKINPYIEYGIRFSKYEARTSKKFLSGGIYYCF